MIERIDVWLDEWATWCQSGAIRLGYSNHSTVYRQMREAARTDKKNNPRRRDQLMVGADAAGNAVTITRHTDPMHCVETAREFNEKIPDNPRCEAMDRAMAALARFHPALEKVVVLIYLRQHNYPMAARKLGLGETAVKARLNHAHYCLDGWLRAVFPELFVE